MLDQDCIFLLLEHPCNLKYEKWLKLYKATDSKALLTVNERSTGHMSKLFLKIMHQKVKKCIKIMEQNEH